MISTPRRMFLQTAALAVPSVTLAVPFIGNAAAAPRTTGRKTDPVLQEVLRQVKTATKAATQPNAAANGGEPLRGLANALRLLAAHGATIGLDEAIAKGLRSTGRQAALAYRPDPQSLTATLKAQGIDADVSQLAVVEENAAARAAALDKLLNEGASAAFLKVAQSFEKLAEKLDKQRGLQLVKRQYVNCGELFWDLFMLEVMMLATCGPWAAAIWEACLVAAAAYYSMKFNLCYIWGCC